MPRAKHPLRAFLNDTKTKISGKNTKRQPCIFCGIYVSAVSREMVTHFEKICKSITAEKKPIISQIIKSGKTNKSINKNVSQSALRAPQVQSPSPAISTVSVTTSNSVLCSPLHKLRVSTQSKDTSILSHFQRNINTQNYVSAVTYFLKWHLSLENVDYAIINEEFNDLVSFLCPSFATKFKKENIVDTAAVFKAGLQRIIQNDIKADNGIIGCFYHSEDDRLSLWVIKDTATYFVTSSYIYDDIFEEQIDELLRTLNASKFRIFGFKVNCDLLRNDELNMKIQDISEKKSIIIIGNLKYNLNGVENDIVSLPGVDKMIHKMEKIVNCIMDHNLIRKELQKQHISAIPDNVIQQINYLNKIKVHLKSICNSESVEIESAIRMIVYMDNAFWANIKLFDGLFCHLISASKQLISSNELTLSEAFHVVKQCIAHYETEEYPTVYNQRIFVDLKRNLKKCLNNIFAKLRNDQAIFEGSNALYYLSYFMDPKYEVSARIYQIKASRLMLQSLCSIEKNDEFQKLYSDLRCRKDYFAENTFCFDDMKGTEYGTFACLAERITHIKSAPLETVLHFCSKRIPDVIDIYCYFNLKNKTIVSKNMNSLLLN